MENTRTQDIQLRGRVQTIFEKTHVKMTFRCREVKTHDVSRLLFVLCMCARAYVCVGGLCVGVDFCV